MKIFGVASLSLVLAGCGGGSYVCNCPANGCDTCSWGEANVAAPFDAGAVTVASADAPCTATLQGSGVIRVKQSGAQTCTVHVGLASGVTQNGLVTFQRVDGPCGCALFASASWSTVQ